MKDQLRPSLLAALVLLPLLLAAGCDKASPVAPSGTTLSISANPSTVSLNGTSTITVIGRQPNGNPLNPGTEIIFSVDKGSIDPIATIQNGGIATATYHADARSGAARITASTGGSSGGGTSGGGGTTSASVDVQVGLSSGDKPTVIVSASPSNVPVGGTATVTVIGRNADGSPAVGQTVILTTSLGSFTTPKPVTGSDGTATSTLKVGLQSGTATISAILGSSEAATAMVTIRDSASDMTITPSGPISIPSAGGSLSFSVFVSNTQGQPFAGATVTFASSIAATFDNNTTTTVTDSSGFATKTLTFSPTALSGHKSFTVTASTPGPTGTLISRVVMVNVTQ
jgi:hypothetical protein